MQKIKLIADTPSDIPDEELERWQIDMPSVPINIDGREYYECRSFSTREFYDILDRSKEIPVTSRVPSSEYVALYKKAWEQGYTDVINVTINARGSGTHDSARMAVDLFFQENPGAKGKMNIHMVDSKTYSAGYGYPVIQAAKMAEQGSTAAQILEYLDDWFDRLEIYLACYSLEYAKKSGRITAAAAFVGDVLGLRPIISMIDSETRTVEKVRGDKQVVRRVFDFYMRRREDPESPVCVVSGSIEEHGDELQAMLEQELGRPVPHYKAGASIVINSGAKMVAICLLGKKRSPQ